MIYPVIIVGAGFSGLVLMNMLYQSGIEHLVLEKQERAGRKILSTGNGRGNISNLNLSSKNYHSNNDGFFDYAIKTYDNRLIARFFEERGVLVTFEDDKMFPISKQANAILDALRLSDKDGRIVLNCHVTNIKYDKAKSVFTLYTADKCYYAKKVVVCVGGKSAPHLGTDGTSYSLAQNFGHKITPLYPSLVQLLTKKDSVKGLKGVKENALVYAYDGTKLLAKKQGDILFTDSGLSGNTIFYLSSYLISAKNPVVKVDFLPDIDKKLCETSLFTRRKLYPQLSSQDILSGLCHSRISLATVKSVIGEGFSHMQFKDIDDKTLCNLIAKLKDTTFLITGSAGFSYSQVTKGGIDTKDVNNMTMESKLQKNLYFCGEVLDVDGDCGGYNLQWAFSSAMCVYKSIIGDL